MMKDLLTVIRIEFLLFRRGWSMWLIAFIMVVLGLFTAGNIHYAAYSAWMNFHVCYFLVTLVLAFTTGNQIYRDRERHLDGVVLSAPVSTASYVCGKYLAALVIMIGFASLNLLASVVMDLLITGQNYPSLGPRPYILSWCWLVLTPILFAAALTLFGITVTRGQRAMVLIAVVLIWLMSLFSGGAIPEALNVTEAFEKITDPAYALGITFNGPAAPSAALAQRAVHLVQVSVPQVYLTPVFLLNRLIFLSMAVLLVLATVECVRRQRRGWLS